MKKYAIVALLLVAMGTACTQENDPTDDTALKERTKEIVSSIFAGQYAPVREQFDPTMEAKLSEEGLAKATSAYEATFGPFVSMGDPEIIDRAALRVVNVPLEMSEAEGQARVTFDARGRIAGLYLLKSGLPVPKL